MLEKIENDYFVENMPKGYCVHIAVWEDELLKVKDIPTVRREFVGSRNLLHWQRQTHRSKIISGTQNE